MVRLHLSLYDGAAMKNSRCTIYVNAVSLERRGYKLLLSVYFLPVNMKFCTAKSSESL